jgi:hypothetical protein
MGTHKGLFGKENSKEKAKPHKRSRIITPVSSKKRESKERSVKERN